VDDRNHLVYGFVRRSKGDDRTSDRELVPLSIGYDAQNSSDTQSNLIPRKDAARGESPNGSEQRSKNCRTKSRRGWQAPRQSVRT
jgi:hypothetical protein